MTNLVTIYELFDPRAPAIVRYVGKAKDREVRLRQHICSAVLAKTPCAAWIRELRDQGITIEMRVIELVEERDWQSTEKYWIAHYRNEGLPLLNVTDGGDGFSITITPEMLMQSLQTHRFRKDENIPDQIAWFSKRALEIADFADNRDELRRVIREWEKKAWEKYLALIERITTQVRVDDLYERYIAAVKKEANDALFMAFQSDG